MTLARSRGLALTIYFMIAALVTGGLAWVTHAALQLELETLELEHAKTVRLALWRLDGRVFTTLAREDSRPVAQYESLYPPMPAIDLQGRPIELGSLLVPTPLLTAELPDWIALHFVVDPTFGWRSPLVMDTALQTRLRSAPTSLVLTNVTPQRKDRLDELHEQYSVDEVLQRFGVTRPTQPPVQQLAQRMDVGQQSAQPQPQGRGANRQVEQWMEAEFEKRQAQQKELRNESKGYESNSGNLLNVMVPGKAILWESVPGNGKAYACCVATNVSEMTPHWLHGQDNVDRLLLIRTVRSDQLIALQGIYLDWPKLHDVLLAEVRDILPNADLTPIIDETRGEPMSALPIGLITDDVKMSIFPLNSPIRWGLAIAWGAAALALLVVGFTGWSLLDLSERRFRFVTAVTHELRTPLTSMRLFLDMLTGGMVKSQKDHDDYLQHLDHESDRLNRLIGNVLDYARLERQKVSLQKRGVTLDDLISSVHADWEGRCKSNGKELVVECAGTLPSSLVTDPDMCKQVLGNLIDNACKYSQGSSDARVWLRVAQNDGSIIFEVEDRGPGVASKEIASIFRPFRRGSKACESAGGIGLGLALASKWAKLLGGRLQLKPDHHDGACFQFIHPIGT